MADLAAFSSGQRVRTAQEPAILAISGSSRKGSHNSRLLDIAVERALALGAEVSVLDLRDLNLPIFDEDVEKEGMPQDVLVFRQVLAAHDGLLVASPEYNASLPPLLKNALDWSSRLTFGYDDLDPYRGRVASIMSASMSPFGGIRGLNHLRAVLSKLGVLVLPEEFCLPLAHQAFDDRGLRDGGQLEVLDRLLGQLVGTLRLTRTPPTIEAVSGE